MSESSPNEWTDPAYADIVETFRTDQLGRKTHCPVCRGIRRCVVRNPATGEVHNLRTCTCTQ